MDQVLLCHLLCHLLCLPLKFFTTTTTTNYIHRQHRPDQWAVVSGVHIAESASATKVRNAGSLMVDQHQNIHHHQQIINDSIPHLCCKVSLMVWYIFRHISPNHACTSSDLRICTFRMTKSAMLSASASAPASASASASVLFMLLLLLQQFLSVSASAAMTWSGATKALQVCYKSKPLEDYFCAGFCAEILALSLIHIWRCRRYSLCRSRWSPYH